MNMNNLRRRRASSHTWVLLAISALAPSVLCAQGRVDTVPEHATARAYGSGWECNPGYQRASGLSDVCTAIALPANAHLTTSSYGRGWECARGYRADAESCVAIGLPPNAYLDSEGNRWKCDRGYRNVASLCAPIELPPHGYLNADGDRWECGRGYREANASCVVSPYRRTDT